MSELDDVNGVELRKLPDDVLAELKKIYYELTAQIAAEDDELAQRIFASYQQYREGVVEYHEISERAYINARAD